MRRSEFQIYHESLLNSPVVTYPYFRWFNYYENDSFKDFKDLMAQLIFDKPGLTDESEKNIIRDIMYLYLELPASHSATSVSKILTRKSKIKTEKIQQYVGRYSKLLKPPQVYELASHIEGFLQNREVFTTKEDYSSGEEWRGAFEFIGSKYVNVKKLNEYLNSI